ncbi:MAG: hypothetical protein D6714_19820, partial [Bacteroidetes bacterium]
QITPPPVLVSSQNLGRSPESILPLTDGGFLLGSAFCASSNESKAALYKYDAQGQEIWGQCYGPNPFSQINDLTPATDGYWAVGNNKGDGWLIRFDEAGTLLWDTIYGGSRYDQFDLLLPMADGNLLIAGTSYSDDGDLPGNYGASDIWIMKVDTLGNILWTKQYGSDGSDVLKDIKPAPDGTFGVLAFPEGDGFDLNEEGNRPWFFRLNDAGDLLSSALLSEPTDGGVLNAMIWTSNEEWLAVGKINDSNETRPWAAFLALDGQLKRDSTYNFINAKEYATQVREYEPGKYLLVTEKDIVTSAAPFLFYHQFRLSGIDDQGAVLFSSGGFHEAPVSSFEEESIKKLWVADNGRFYVFKNKAISKNAGWLYILEFPVTPTPDHLPDTTVCIGQPLLLDNRDPNCPYCTYQWEAFPFTAVPEIIVSQPGDYRVTITSAPGIFVVDTVHVGVKNPDFIIQLRTISGCGPQNGVAEVFSSGGASGAYTYAWSNGATTPLVEGLPGGQYAVTVYDGDCFLTDSVFLDTDERADLEWARSWGGSKDETPESLFAMPDGGWLATGISESKDKDIAGGKGSTDIWMTRFDSIGQLMWQKNYGSSGLDYLHGSAADGFGNIWLAGKPGRSDFDFADYMPQNAWDSDVFYLKTNDIGDIEFVKFLSGNENDRVTAVNGLPDGGAVIAVSTKSDAKDFDVNKGGYDPWLVRVNTGGDVIWKKNYAKPSSGDFTSQEFISDIEPTPDGSFLIAGSRDTIPYTPFGYGNLFWMAKVSASGDLLWEKELDILNSGTAKDVRVLSDGNYIWAGTFDNHRVRVVKTDPDGNILWEKLFEGIAHFVKILETPEGDILVHVSNQLNPPTHSRFTLDSDGNLLKKMSLDPVLAIVDLAWSADQKHLGFLSSGGEFNFANTDSRGEKDFWIGTLGAPLKKMEVLAADTIVCPGDEVILNAVVPDCANCEYLWEDGSVDPIRSFTSSKSIFAKLIVTHPDGCQLIDYQHVTQNELDIRFAVTDANCGISNGAVKAIPVNSAAGNYPPYSYMWDTGETDPMLDTIPAGIYAVSVSDGICMAAQSVEIGVNEALREEVWSFDEEGFGQFSNLIEMPDSAIFGLLHLLDSSQVKLLKFGKDGQLVWEKELEPGDKAIAATPDGHFGVVGNAQDSNGVHFVVLKKTDVSGAVIWSKNFEVPNFQTASGLTVSPDGGFVIVGQKRGGGGLAPGYYGGNLDAWVIKT